MSWIISAIPSMHCARVMTSAPACISSATVRPSRAPSTMKSEMIAMASGWLSLTPRSSRRRATMAAIEIRSLSFSRGDRFIGSLYQILIDLIEPEPRQRRGGGAAEHRHHIGAEPRGILGTEARHCKSIPGGDADFSAEGACELADSLHQSLIAGRDQRRPDRDAALGDGGHRELLADIAIKADSLGKHQPATTAQAPAVDELPAQHTLAHRRAAEHHNLAQQERGIFRQVDVDPPRNVRAVEQNGFLRQPGEMRAGFRLQRDIELRGWPRRAVDLLRRRRGQRQPRPLTGCDVDVETVATGNAARGVDEHGGKTLGLGRGKSHAQRAGLMQLSTAGDAILQTHVKLHRAL